MKNHRKLKYFNETVKLYIDFLLDPIKLSQFLLFLELLCDK